MKFRPPLYKKGKTYKRPYTGSKSFAKSCRNHGSCPHCERNRTFFDKKKRKFSEIDLMEIDSESR